MKPIGASVGGAKCCLAAILGSSFLTISVSAAPALKAFPTAEGFGAKAVGGRGGRVIEVATLEDSGPGSLRAAMEASGPRIVVFRVSGTITLTNAIRVRAPYLTVAGQTSPGGVEIKGNGQPEGDWGVWCVNGAHDLVLRHLRVRIGGNMKHDAGDNAPFYGTAEPGVHDVIVDHCSVSWGSDTQLDWYGSSLDRATFQWNIIGECFMGQHIGGNRAPQNITLHHKKYEVTQSEYLSVMKTNPSFFPGDLSRPVSSVSWFSRRLPAACRGSARRHAEPHGHHARHSVQRGAHQIVMAITDTFRLRTGRSPWRNPIQRKDDVPTTATSARSRARDQTF